MKPIINIPHELLADRILLSEIINPAYDKIALVLLGENMDFANKGPFLIRICLFIKAGGECLFEKELEAFFFDGLDPVFDFLKNLPNMSALDLLLRMHAPGALWDDMRVH